MRKRLYEVQTQPEYLSEEKLKKTLAEHKADIKDYAYILHNKDTNEDGTAKKPHWHIMLSLYEGRRHTDVASWFGISASYIQDSKSGRYENMLLYLIHENAPEKFQYNEDDVYANFDIRERLEKIRHKTTTEKREDEIIDSIATGAIRKYNLNQFVTAKEYTALATKIKRAFEYRSIVLSQKNERNMDVVFIYGPGGTGKSTFAEKIAERRGFSYKRSASSRDPFQTYEGQDAFILDDVRPDTFKFDDWLGILDNFKDRQMPARFSDRSFTECKLLILTCNQSPIDFWKELKKERPHEDAHQFYRRVKYIVEMTKTTISRRYYIEADQVYSFPRETPNDVIAEFSIKSETSDEIDEKMSCALAEDEAHYHSPLPKTLEC